jgi:CheY-like chemotaxis protein
MGDGLRSADVLIVEDNPAEVRFLSEVFQICFVHVRLTCARDGEEAIQTLADGSYTPDLIILDLKLPKTDGLGVLRSVRENARTKDVPVVIFTSSAFEFDMERAYLLQANAYIVKPVGLNEYISVIQGVCKDWLRLNAN